MAKKTQVELLQEIADLLLPVSNLAKFNISQINIQLDKQKAAQEAPVEMEVVDGEE